MDNKTSLKDLWEAQQRHGRMNRPGQVNPPDDMFHTHITVSRQAEKHDVVPRKITQYGPAGGGRPLREADSMVDANHTEFGWALVQYKSMEELIKENPKHFFDSYGNFNNGRTVEAGYNQENGVYDHLAPSYFGQMGKTAHRRFQKEDGAPKDTWYYKVLDY